MKNQVLLSGTPLCSSTLQSRAITAENKTGEKGQGGKELDGRKGLPCLWKLKKNQVYTFAEIEGPGMIRHIWITVQNTGPLKMRNLILRFYWDDQKTPSVEVPVGDFFCNGFNTRINILAIPINVNPSGGLNSYFPMSFRKHAKITIENRSPEEIGGFFYAINYTLTEIPEDEAYFHAQFRRTHPLPYKEDYVIIDNIKGKGHFVGTYMAWQQNNKGWWGEGEIKMFIDDDGEFPTICGTGTEDYFGGAWGFGETYSAPFIGYPLGVKGEAKQGDRHGLYRFHIMDPVRFDEELKVTMQAIGWRSEGRYLPMQDDISSVAYWYQAEPHNTFPKLPDRDYMEVI